MIIIKKGNLLEATESLICHQVNENGVMGGGLALQIANKYPMVEVAYRTFVEKNNDYKLLGEYQVIGINKDQSIVNCFTQKNFNTSYDLIEKIFRELKKIHPHRSIAIPFNYGCGIANGDFTKVLEILTDIFDDTDITIYKYEVQNDSNL